MDTARHRPSSAARDSRRPTAGDVGTMTELTRGSIIMSVVDQLIDDICGPAVGNIQLAATNNHRNDRRGKPTLCVNNSGCLAQLCISGCFGFVNAMTCISESSELPRDVRCTASVHVVSTRDRRTGRRAPRRGKHTWTGIGFAFSSRPISLSVVAVASACERAMVTAR